MTEISLGPHSFTGQISMTYGPGYTLCVSFSGQETSSVKLLQWALNQEPITYSHCVAHTEKTMHNQHTHKYKWPHPVGQSALQA